MRRLVLLVALAGLVLLVAPPPSPVHLSYVTSDSMAPTLETGDAYLVIDWGTPTTGDILVYDAETREGYTTHRIVGTTPAGYQTQGDANPTMDQASGEPPVTEDQILGTVLSVGDQPLAIPLLGSLAATVGVQDAALLIVGLLGVGAVGQRTKRVPDRPVPRVSSVFLALAALFVITAALSLTMAPTTHTITYTATETGSEAPAAVPVGEQSTVELTVDVHGLPLTHTVFEADGATITSVENGAGGATLTAALPARAQPGRFDVAVTAVPYPQTLPGETIAALHGIHPVAARLATIAAAVLPLWLLYWLCVDGQSLLRLPVNHRLPMWGDRR